MKKTNHNSRARRTFGKLLTAGVSAASLALLAPGSAQAATYSWDPSQTPATPSGGTGTWDTTASVWSDGATDSAWTANTITGDTAAFGGAAGTVTLGTAINALGLQFTTTGYTIALGGNTLSLGTGGIDLGALSSGTATISGSGTLAVAADQTWSLGSSSLAVSSALSLGSSTTLTKSGTGTLTLSSYLTGGGTLSVGTGGVNLQTTGANNSTYGLYNGFTGAIDVSGTLGFNSPGSSNGADYNYNLSNAAVTVNSGGSTVWNSANGSTTNNPGVAYINFGSIAGAGTLGGAAGGTGNTKGVRYVVGTLNSNTTFSGVIAAGAGQLGDALTKVGAGTLTLTGANTYTGITFGTFSIPATTIRGGTLQVGDGTSGSLASGGALTFQDTGRLVYQGTTSGSSTQTLGALTFSQGAGTVQSAYGAGTTTLTFASLAARAAGATGNFATSGGTNGSTNLITITSAPTTGTQLDRGYFFNGSSYAAYDAGGFIRAYGSGDANYVTATGSNAISSVSTDNVALTGNVDTQATAAINTLNMGANTLALASGAAFQTNGILASGSSASTISGGASLAATTSGAELVIRVDGSTDALDISTPIIANGTNALTKTGAGTLTLSATGNTYSGTTYVDEGTLTISGSNTGNGAYVVNNSGILNVSGTLTSTGAMTVANGSGNGTVNVSGNVTIGGLTISNSATGYDTGSGTVNINGGTLTSTQDVTVGLGGTQIGKLVINSGTVNVATTAEKWLKLGQWDTSNGEIDINGGTLNLNTNTDIRFSVNSGGGINVINQNGGTVASYSGNQTGLGSGNVLDLQNASSATANNTYNLNGGTLNISQITSTNTTGTRTFNFNGGTLKNTAASTTFLSLGSGSARANVRNGGAIIDTTNGSVTIAQALAHSNISGDNAIDGGLTKQGANTLTLSGANTYTGATTISAGTIALASGGSLASTSLSIAAGATLDVSAQASYSLASNTIALTLDGSSMGLINAGALAVDFSSAALTLNVTTGTPGTSYDFLTSTSAATGNLASVSLGGSFSGSLSQAGDIWSGTSGGFNFSLDQTSGALTITAVPEPHEFALAIVALLGVMVYIHRRNQQA